MKFFIGFLFLIVISSALAIKEEKRPTLRNMFKECQDDIGVDDSLLPKIRNGDASLVDDKANDFTFCFFKKAGLMTDDGTMIKEGFLGWVNDVDKELVGKSVDKCNNPEGSTAAEKAWNFWVCYRKERGDVAL